MLLAIESFLSTCAVYTAAVIGLRADCDIKKYRTLELLRGWRRTQSAKNWRSLQKGGEAECGPQLDSRHYNSPIVTPDRPGFLGFSLSIIIFHASDSELQFQRIHIGQERQTTKHMAVGREVKRLSRVVEKHERRPSFNQRGDLTNKLFPDIRFDLKPNKQQNMSSSGCGDFDGTSAVPADVSAAPLTRHDEAVHMCDQIMVLHKMCSRLKAASVDMVLPPFRHIGELSQTLKGKGHYSHKGHENYNNNNNNNNNVHNCKT
ncbi:hypothetical protein JOB18_004139 [Solea senegalensis]|uniref:Uncharacterized protein n=1 Tax=Solea senegalensis TaxID=28829 RepID=A0AAV6PD43_SOLSE|nr:hypothetical protein JOB18_004139 [Solea senegalensis]